MEQISDPRHEGAMSFLRAESMLPRGGSGLISKRDARSQRFLRDVLAVSATWFVLLYLVSVVQVVSGWTVPVREINIILSVFAFLFLLAKNVFRRR